MHPLAVDLETSLGGDVFGPSAKDPNNDYYTIQWGTSPQSVTVCHELEGFKRQPPEAFLKQLGNASIVIGHNLAFDLGYLWKLPEWQAFMKRGGEIWDTQRAEYLLSGQRHKFPSLAELQLIYLGKRIKADRISYCFKKLRISPQDIIKTKDRCKRLFALYEQYAHDDVSTVLQIFKAQWVRCQKDGALDYIRARQKALLGITLMTNTGIELDTVNCEKTLREFKLISLEKLEEASKLVMPMWDERLPAFNINSPKDKSAILFGGTFQIKEKVEDGTFKNGNPKYKTIFKDIEIKGFQLPINLSREGAKAGQYSTDSTVIQNIATNSNHPKAVEYCKLQTESMHYSKMASTYLAPFLKYQIEGKIYPEYNTSKLVTSRLSAKNPNTQNLPQLDPFWCKATQGQFIAPEGWLCCDIDYVALEPWSSGLLTEDPALINDLLSGICLHCKAVTWIPRLSQGKSYEEIYDLSEVQRLPEWKLARKKAKGFNFKQWYGGGAASISAIEDIPVEDVQAAFKGRDLDYPVLKQFNDRLLENLPNNQQISKAIHLGAEDRKGRAFEYGLELLPIFQSGFKKGDKPTYIKGEYRHFGTYKSRFGHSVVFEETGRYDKWGRLRRGYSTTQTKNYQIQSLAALIVELAICECFDYVLKNGGEVQLVRQIHDSLGLYIKDNEDKNLHIQNLCAIMNNIKHLFKKYLGKEVGFNFRTEAKVGQNFAQMSEQATTE